MIKKTRFQLMTRELYNLLDWSDQQMLELHREVLYDLCLEGSEFVFDEEVRGIEPHTVEYAKHHDLSAFTPTRSDLPIECKTETYPSDNSYFEISANLPWMKRQVAQPGTPEWDALLATARAAVSEDESKTGLLSADLAPEHLLSYVRLIDNDRATWRLLRTVELQKWVSKNLATFDLAVSAPRPAEDGKGWCVSIGVLVPDSRLSNVKSKLMFGDVSEEFEMHFDALKAKAAKLKVEADKRMAERKAKSDEQLKGIFGENN